jgi:prolyl-tRNA synthetase
MWITCFQVVIIPIWKKDDDKTGVLNAASSVKDLLQTAGFKVKLDDSDQRTPGWKFNFWEMKVCPFSRTSNINFNSLGSGLLLLSNYYCMEL